MSSRPSDLLIEDILAAIGKVEHYTHGLSKLEFLSDDKTVDAVVRNLEIIGEAASRLPTEFKEATSQIPWVEIVGLRHRIVHEYFGVDDEIVWHIVQNDLPNLRVELGETDCR